MPELSVVCFRHVPAALRDDAAGLDAHQDRLQAALEASGDGWLTTTRLRGSTWLRAGIVNYLSTEDDLDQLLATLRRLAAEGSAVSRRAWSGDRGRAGAPCRRGCDRRSPRSRTAGIELTLPPTRISSDPRRGPDGWA